MRWTPEQYDAYVRKRATGVGAVEASKPEPTPSPALDSDQQKQPKCKESMGVCCRVVLIAALRRELDSDNLQSSLKALRDAVAEWLGVDDRDKRVTWEYGQVLIKGTPGVIVRIEQV